MMKLVVGVCQALREAVDQPLSFQVLKIVIGGENDNHALLVEKI
jgi:hypothetical protein